MKNRKSSLFALITRHYLLFTLTILMIVGATYFLWSNAVEKLYEPVDWDAMLEDSALREGDYSALAKRMTKNNEFAVYDESDRRIYSSTVDPMLDLSAGELECVPEYNGNTYIDNELYTDKNGVSYEKLTKYSYTTGGEAAESGSVLLDGHHNVVSGGLGDGKSAYTDKEYALLTGKAGNGYNLYKYFFADKTGKKNTLLVKNGYIDTQDMLKGYEESWNIWLIAIPLYLLAVGLFIWRLNRTIRKPLDRINTAVVSQAEGQRIRIGECGGTKEISRIAESFDKLSAQLEESEAERKRLDESRQELIADISHDLKTPITVISGYAEAICDGKVPPEEEKRYLAVIKEKAGSLNELINSFHEYSKTEHPDYALHVKKTDICEFSREYLAEKYDEIDIAGFSLDVEIPEAEVLCDIDELPFCRALDNIVSNSLKYNKNGTTLRFSIVEKAGEAEIRIADDGGGIPPECAERIFEPFVTGSDARGSGGSGLGLSISRRIIELHGGAIALAEKKNGTRGSEFILTLPLSK